MAETGTEQGGTADSRAGGIRGTLMVRKNTAGDPIWFGTWRDSGGRALQRKIGPAWLKARNPFAVVVPQTRAVESSWMTKWETPKRKTADPGFLRADDAAGNLRALVYQREIEIDAEHLAHVDARAGAPIKFAAVIDSWIAEREKDVADDQLKRSTLKDYRSMLRPPGVELRPRARKDDDGKRLSQRAWIRTAFDSKDAQEITLADVEKLENAMREAGLALQTRAKYNAVVSMLFDHAVFVDAIAINPLALRPRAKRTRRRKPVVKVYDQTTIEAIAAAAKTPFDSMIRLAAYTGLRQGELLALRWGNVNFSERSITIEATFGGSDIGEDAPKSGAARTVPMSVKAGAVLDELSKRERWTARENLVFGQRDGNERTGQTGRTYRPYTWKNIDASTVRREYGKARDSIIAKRAGAGETMDPLTFHHLRHAFGSSCAADGVDMPTLQRWMGHEKSDTTQIYVHFAPQHDDADRLSRAQARGTASEIPATELEVADDVLTE